MKNVNAFLSFIALAALVFLSFYLQMPTSNEEKVVPPQEFAVDRAMTPLLEMTKKPHYLGSEAHKEVQKLLIVELNKLGLEPHIQSDYSLNTRSKTLNKPANILARIKGSEDGKALLLLAHYDSAPVPSFGAADDASGIVTILESVRAYLASGARPKNDIIILFSDAEELGLDGAKLFVNEHPWAKDVGLALNFEARGTSGASNMILETNGGNSNLIKEFVEANPEYPVGSSLMYSIYKMLPNDTDSTVFREDGDIDSFFFAFIDSHYNYHTANDTYYNLDRNSLMHQGSYLLPLIHHFADADLSSIKSTTDDVYFNFPLVKMVHYPFSWIYPMLAIGILIFLFLLYYGSYKRKLKTSSIFIGFLPLLISLVGSGILGYFGWKLLLTIYPQYSEIQQGFTYNGYWYIAFFVALSLAVSFYTYGKFTTKTNKPSLYVAPLLLWLILNTFLAIYLKGGSYFIIPVFFGLLSFFVMIRQKYPNPWAMVLLAVPAIFIFAPLVQALPVGLGLKMLMVSNILTVLLFTLLFPVFGYYRAKGLLTVLSLLAATFFFIKAHSQSDFSETRKKPNSLIYYEDADAQKAYWTTYDKNLDSWTSKYLGEEARSASEYIESDSYSKYGIHFTYAIETENRNMKKSEISILKDTVSDALRTVQFMIKPQRNINKIELYGLGGMSFTNLEFNGKNANFNSENDSYRGTKNAALVNYFVVDNEALEVQLTVKEDIPLHFKVLEYGFDLIDHPEFNIEERQNDMMPKPFVMTDAIVTKHTFSIDSLKAEVSD